MNAALIGRDHPSALLHTEISRSMSSHGGLVLVAGEAGIGKTTLVTHAAGLARARGALVLSGSCWHSDSAPGYWPWVQVMRALRRSPEWSQAEQATGSRLAGLLGDPSSDDFQLYDSVTTALVSASQTRPVIVVLDDLHWADPASVRLLEFAAQHTWFERLLLVGTYRDAEVEPGAPPLQPLLAKASVIPLTGLGAASVGELMARVAGRRPPEPLVAEVHTRTGGNPFFVEQIARLWQGGGSVSASAPGIRDAVLRRIDLLPAPVSALLSRACVLGRQFHRQVLAALAEEPVAHVDRLLDQAVSARLVVALGDGLFSFVHDLVRETLYAGLAASARELHAAVVAAVERQPELAGHLQISDLAGHAHLAGDRVDPERAVELLLEAAGHADLRLAVDESISHHRRALEAATSLPPARQAQIALDLAGQLWHTRDHDGATVLYTRALAIARDIDDPVPLAKVALAGRRGLYSGESGQELMREAYVRLVGRAPASTDGPASTEGLAQDLAIQLALRARESDDDEALVAGLWSLHDSIWAPGTAKERIDLTDELLRLFRRTGNAEGEHFAAALRWVAHLELGESVFLERFGDYVTAGSRSGHPLVTFSTQLDQAIIDCLMGRFEACVALVRELHESQEAVRNDHCGHMIGHLEWAALLLQGRPGEVGDLHRRMRDSTHPCPVLVEALTALRLGDVDAALRLLAEATTRGERRVRSAEPLWIRFQAELAAITGDPELCAKARSWIAPHRGRWAVSLFGWDVSGPFDYWAALVDAAESRWEEAVAGFTAARESAVRLGARPWAVLAGAGLGEALLASGAAGAAEVLGSVEREAAALGMEQVALRARAALEREEPVVARRASIVSADGVPVEFTRQGTVWRLAYGGRVAHLPDAKGLRDLHLLLAAPGRDLPAVALLAPEGGDLVVAARSLGGDDLLDDEARTRYRRHLERLDDEIDRAAGLGDDDRAATLDRERQALLEQLRSAAGLDGRSRRLGDEAERARKTVTARIRDVLRKLDAAHPELAAHLRETVSTGSTCRYQPAEPVSWTL
ncbi:ATP-binding protein [Nonomuraea soli]|uniref:Energy-coupling factor transporter ATP-binding protein EcfA2 n=1 Tax=Nonomuraea soli TaxID=1032476 RepID=A0A7W0CTL3_9ACTN|nr:AAA family ATPase [Nonomuraea soli]MBA2896900.1 energy-coupling factor transporter ATP-binding protein EcfA2 [Nonomuraea soli]